MSVLAWFSFIRDSRMLDNFLTFDLALSMFNAALDQEVQHNHNPNNNPNTHQTMHEDENATASSSGIDELSWLSACRNAMLCKMCKTITSTWSSEEYSHNKTSKKNNNKKFKKRWKEDISILFDDLYMGPLALLIQKNIVRPKWQCRWLSSVFVVTEIACGNYAE